MLLQPGERRQETPARIHRLGTGGALRRHTLGGARTIRNNEIGHRVYMVKGDNGAAGSRGLTTLAKVRSEAVEAKTQ
jgi:hypothetical protein